MTGTRRRSRLRSGPRVVVGRGVRGQDPWPGPGPKAMAEARSSGSRWPRSPLPRPCGSLQRGRPENAAENRNVPPVTTSHGAAGRGQTQAPRSPHPRPCNSPHHGRPEKTAEHRNVPPVTTSHSAAGRGQTHRPRPRRPVHDRRAVRILAPATAPTTAALRRRRKTGTSHRSPPRTAPRVVVRRTIPGPDAPFTTTAQSTSSPLQQPAPRPPREDGGTPERATGHHLGHGRGSWSDAPSQARSPGSRSPRRPPPRRRGSPRRGGLEEAAEGGAFHVARRGAGSGVP